MSYRFLSVIAVWLIRCSASIFEVQN